jgi:ABC-type polysaccharide/polyol phosphate export permease
MSQTSSYQSTIEPVPGGGKEPAQAAAASPSRAPLAEMAWELIHYRDLLWQMVLRDLRLRYKQAVMGFGWAVLMPVVTVAAGFLLKYAMAQSTGTTVAAPAISGMAIKALGWTFFVGAVGFAVSSLTGNINLVTKIYFPREVFPLSAVITQVVDTMVGAVATLVVLVLFAPVGVGWQTFWVLPLAVLLVLFTAGVALLTSCANVFFRDVKYLVQMVLTFGVLFTPVFFEPQMFGPRGCVLMMLNPLAPLLEGLRLAVVEHHDLLAPLVVTAPSGQAIVAWTPWYLAYSAAWSLLGGFAAWRAFHELEFVFPEYI